MRKLNLTTRVMPACLPVLVLTALIAGQALAQEQPSAQEQQVAGDPVPEGARLADTHSMKMGSLNIDSKLYLTSLTLAQVEFYYRSYFAKQEYETILDKYDAPKKLLRFKKNDAVVAISLRPQGKETQIVLARYSQPFGTLPPEKTKLSWMDLVQGLPTQEQPGEELKVVPRPPQSLRMGGGRMKNVMMLFYRSGVSCRQVSDFYQKVMPDLGWQQGKSYDMAQKNREFKDNFAKKRPGINLPFADTSFEEIIRGGTMLEYTGEWGQASISIFNANDTAQTSLVLIKYAEKIAGQ